MRDIMTGFKMVSEISLKLLTSWPSGLRRCVKAAVFLAWVRIPPKSLFLLGNFHMLLVDLDRSKLLFLRGTFHMLLVDLGRSLSGVGLNPTEVTFSV